MIEQGIVRIVRANYRCELPANFQLIAVANPCPCGFYGTPGRDCRCDDATLNRYRRKLSGPLLDRVDVGVTVGEVPSAILRVRARAPQARLSGGTSHARGTTSAHGAWSPTRRFSMPISINSCGPTKQHSNSWPRCRGSAAVRPRSAPLDARGAHNLRSGGPENTHRGAIAEALQIRLTWSKRRTAGGRFSNNWCLNSVIPPRIGDCGGRGCGP